MKVMLVFDPDYGDETWPELGDAFWLIDSCSNRSLATRAWEARSADANSALFDPPASAATGGDVVGRLEDIDLHHPDWIEIGMVGVSLTPELRARLEASGYNLVTTAKQVLVRRKSCPTHLQRS